MGKCEPRDKPSERSPQRERRYAAILQAAEDLFLEQGYENTTLAEIVRMSRGSLATLYEMFGNKQGLLHAIARRWSGATLAKSFDGKGPPSQSKIDLLREYARHQAEVMRSPHTVALMRMMISEGFRDRSFARQTYDDLHRPAIRELSSLFAQWTAAGDSDFDRPEAAAELFLSLVAGNFALNALAGVEDDSLEDDMVQWRLEAFFALFRLS